MIVPDSVRQFTAAQGNCAGPVDEVLLAEWREQMPDSPLPLKAHQCLILAGSKALFAQNGRLWLHNLYLAAMLPAFRNSRLTLLLSTGYIGTFDWPDPIQVAAGGAAAAADAAADAPWAACSGTTDLELYLTAMVLHSPPRGGSTVALIPLTSQASVSLLAQGAPPEPGFATSYTNVAGVHMSRGVLRPTHVRRAVHVCCTCDQR